jgi:iron complex transport system substrate-binding protein
VPNRITLILVAAMIVVLIASKDCFASRTVLTDDLGRTVVLNHPPSRIISLEPSVTEILYAVGASRKIVADDFFSDYPLLAKHKIHVNGIAPSREMVVGLQPDLIILFDQTFTVQKANSWQRIYGAPVYVTNAGTYKAVEADILHIGIIAGQVKTTKLVIGRMNHALTTVQQAVLGRPRPKVFVVVWNRPLMTAGRGTFIDNLISIAGGTDVASDTVSGYPTYSPERLLADDPDIIITGASLGDSIQRSGTVVAGLELRAQRRGFCYSVPDDWTVRPGPRLALGLVALAKVIHPECFRK